MGLVSWVRAAARTSGQPSSRASNRGCHISNSQQAYQIQSLRHWTPPDGNRWPLGGGSRAPSGTARTSRSSCTAAVPRMPFARDARRPLGFEQAETGIDNSTAAHQSPAAAPSGRRAAESEEPPEWPVADGNPVRRPRAIRTRRAEPDSSPQLPARRARCPPSRERRSLGTRRPGQCPRCEGSRDPGCTRPRRRDRSSPG